MGHRHRETRKSLKAGTRTLEAQGWYENEFGELQKRTTKANARRWLLNLRQVVDDITASSLESGRQLIESLKSQMEYEVVGAMAAQAYRDMASGFDHHEALCREIDLELFESLSDPRR